MKYRILIALLIAAFLTISAKVQVYFDCKLSCDKVNGSFEEMYARNDSLVGNIDTRENPYSEGIAVETNMHEQSLESLCTEASYSSWKRKRLKNHPQTIDMIRSTKDGKALCVYNETETIPLTDLSDNLKVINELHTAIIASFTELRNEFEQVKKDGNKYLQCDGETTSSFARKYIGLLQPIINELSQCVKPGSSQYYKQSHFLPSRKIYELFTHDNADLYSSLLVNTNHEVYGYVSYSKLSTLLFDMFKMSNYCNENYIKAHKNLMYACNILIDIDEKDKNLYKIFNSGITKGLMEVVEQEDKDFSNDDSDY